MESPSERDPGRFQTFHPPAGFVETGWAEINRQQEEALKEAAERQARQRTWARRIAKTAPWYIVGALVIASVLLAVSQCGSG